MEFEKLEKTIQDIITLVEKFEEPYREKCFEILLSNYLRKAFPPETTREDEEGEEAEEEGFSMPLDVRAFLSQYEIPEENLQKLFLMEEGEVKPIYMIPTRKKASGQMQIALLTALENALRAKGNKFEFAIETVRQRCKNRKVYDGPNFARTFSRHESYFTSLAEEEHVELSPEGKTELAEVISTVAKK